MFVKERSLESLIASLFLFLICSSNVKAQNFKQFLGFYQLHQNKDLYVQISEQGGKLKLTQQWDYKDFLFQQQTDSSFLNLEMNYPLVFTDEKVIGREGDIWERSKNYKPKIIKRLTEEELTEVKTKLNFKVANLIHVINSNSLKELSVFASQNFSTTLNQNIKEDFNNRCAFIYRATGGLGVGELLEINPFTQLATYRYKSNNLNNFFELSLKLDKDNKITLFNSRMTTNFGLLEKRGSEKEILDKIRSTLSSLDKKDVFSGTVLISKNNNILFEYACGEAIKELHMKNNIETKINLGSINKMFTSVAIMQLAEKGKLNLNDKIVKYIDTTWLKHDIITKITIHQLLSHTSGLGDFFSEEFEKTPKAQFSTLKGFKPFIKSNILAFEPGTNWEYSNTGMLILGVIIEQVSGINYFDYVEQNIFRPSGMVASNIYDLKDERDNIATGYVLQENGTYLSNANIGSIRGSSAGGGYSTAKDLHQFALAFNDNKLISASSKNKMVTDYMNKQYGYGFQLWNILNEQVIGHSGGAEGISAVLYIFPDKGYTISVLSNYDRGAHWIGEYLLQEVANIK